MKKMEIRKKLRINSLLDKMEDNKIRWYDNINRMDKKRLPRQTVDYNLKLNCQNEDLDIDRRNKSRKRLKTKK